MKTTYDNRQQFGQWVRRLREERNLSQRELDELSGVSSTMVCGIEKGDRAVNACTGERIANALQLTGRERDEFLLLAASTRRRDKLVDYAREVPSEILNFLPKVLMEAGVDLASLSICNWRRDENGRVREMEIQRGELKPIKCAFALTLE